MKETAKEILKNRGIEFSEESFIKSVRNNEQDIVKIFLDAGIHPDTRDENGDSALLIAALSRSTETFNLLIKAGAKTDELVKSVYKKKLSTKDCWDKLSSLSSIGKVLSGLLIAVIGWHFTNTYNARQLESQILQAKEQNRLQELDVVSKMVPSLASDNEQEKRVAMTIINILGSTRLATELGVLNPSPGVVDAMLSIAANPNISPEDRKLAIDALKTIKSFDPEEIIRLIESEEVSRNINEVILHHTGIASSQYKSENSIFSIARLNIERWNNIGYHYLIAPDGTVWQGEPLNKAGIHTAGHNDKSVGIALILDGNIEKPTKDQEKSASMILKALFNKFDIEAKEYFKSGKGFHNDYSATTCPGKLITKELVLGWFENP